MGVKKSVSAIGTFFIVFAFILLITPYAEAQQKLVVYTDSDLYEPGSEVKVSIAGRPYAPVAIEVRGPQGELVVLKQIELDAKGFGIFAFKLDQRSPEGVYVVYVAALGAFNTTTFTVVARPSPILLLALPGVLKVGEETAILGFAYPGLPLKVRAYVRIASGEWAYLGEHTANVSGWFSIQFRPLMEGVYEVKVEFEGTRDYGPASSSASSRAVAVPPQWRVEAPATAWLGESFLVNCSGCESVIARTVAGERTYKCGSRITLDVPGPWILYPSSGGARGVPAITLVRARLDVRVEGPREVGVNEPFTLAALLSIPVPALRVTLRELGGTILAEPVSRSNGTALARITLAKAGEYTVEAIPQRTSVFEPGEVRPLTVRVLGERAHVGIIVVDNAGRRLYNSLVEVGGILYEAPMGYVGVTVRAGIHEVRVLWRGLTVFHGSLRLEAGNVTIRAELYDFTVRVVDFLGRPASGVLVELYNGTRRLAAGVTGDDGALMIIRVPPGVYTVKAGDTSTEIVVPEQSEVTLKLPLPLWAVALAALFIIAAATVWAALRYVKVKR